MINTMTRATALLDVNYVIGRIGGGYVAYVADTTCRLRPPVSCLPDMSYDMSDMSSNVGATCRDVAPTEIAPKTRHVATSGD